MSAKRIIIPSIAAGMAYPALGGRHCRLCDPHGSNVSRRLVHRFHKTESTPAPQSRLGSPGPTETRPRSSAKIDPTLTTSRPGEVFLRILSDAREPSCLSISKWSGTQVFILIMHAARRPLSCVSVECMWDVIFVSPIRHR
jgi:hypothetical protein